MAACVLPPLGLKSCLKKQPANDYMQQQQQQQQGHHSPRQHTAPLSIQNAFNKRVQDSDAYYSSSGTVEIEEYMMAGYLRETHAASHTTHSPSQLDTPSTLADESCYTPWTCHTPTSAPLSPMTPSGNDFLDWQWTTMPCLVRSTTPSCTISSQQTPPPLFCHKDSGSHHHHHHGLQVDDLTRLLRNALFDHHGGSHHPRGRSPTPRSFASSTRLVDDDDDDDQPVPSLVPSSETSCSSSSSPCSGINDERSASGLGDARCQDPFDNDALWFDLEADDLQVLSFQYPHQRHPVSSHHQMSSTHQEEDSSKQEPTATAYLVPESSRNASVANAQASTQSTVYAIPDVKRVRFPGCPEALGEVALCVGFSIIVSHLVYDPC